MRQSRQALELEKLGETHYNNSAHFLADGSNICYDVPQSEVNANGETIFTNYLPGVTPVCQFTDEEAGMAVFNILHSFRFPESFGGQGLGPALSLLYLLCCAIYYIAISDSTSFIVDNVASNGRKNNHWARRMFWASSVGTLTTTLLSSGSSDALRAVEAAVIVGSLPAAFLMCGMFQSIYLFCENADKLNDRDGDVDYQFPAQPEFAMPVYGGVFNIFEFVMSFGKVNSARVNLGMDRPTRFQVIEFVKGLLIPFVSLNQIMAKTYPQNPRTNVLTVSFYTVCYVGGVGLWLLSWMYPGLTDVCATLLGLAGVTLAIVRAGFRAHYNIRSNYFADLLAGAFLWPQVFVQMKLQNTGTQSISIEAKKGNANAKKSCPESDEYDSDDEQCA
jgi:BCCT, betaine/carnitine/choline family transporter